MQNGDENWVKIGSDEPVIFFKRKKEEEKRMNLFLGAMCSSRPDAPFAPICSTKSKT
jgi:hypothetical protein